MHASIRRYKIRPGAAEELLQRVNQGFAAIISQAPGFIAYYALNAGNDVVVSFSLFDSADNAAASNRLAADWVRENIASLVAGPPEISGGLVTTLITAQSRAAEDESLNI
ncbi:antibiotic biosynthesis monooxygenase [Zobellella iuensis]|uniref:Antibiotic biosynthesis monooxygenase n=1 Tax=Zobellella iuensis TaxID=2803811 RepID=A0ABS1QSG2_9GAMM|nr:antibiotic biosynthesis monooxygenase [Zobellella iuensis]MBL1377814.1 antibiotic biosynthesis monooxygenase [Zobellella iuensis]